MGLDSRHRFHASLNGGYRWGFRENWTLLPGFNLRIPPKSPASLDLNLHADYNNVFGIGVGFRVGDAINATAVFKIREQFAIAYTFDYSITRIQSVAQNTHEISLRFTTCKPDRSSAAACPLFE